MKVHGSSKRFMVLGLGLCLMAGIAVFVGGCEKRRHGRREGEPTATAAKTSGEQEAVVSAAQTLPAPKTEPTKPVPGPGPNEQVVGFASGGCAERFTAENRERMAARPMQDLLDKTTGRYTMDTDDGVQSHWGLAAIKARCEVGPKPNEKLHDADGVYQTERVIYGDLGTGATMMMLTRLPYAADGMADQLNYFGKACWSADGSTMVWVRDAKPGLWGPNFQKTTDVVGPMLVDADGGRPRIGFGKGKSMKPPHCSPARAEAAYAWTRDGVVELNLRTGEVVKTIGENPGSWHMKVSPDDKYVLNKEKTGFWVASTVDGKTWHVKLDIAKTGACYPIHDSYRFVPADTDWIMYWYERGHPGGGLGKEGFRLRNFKTNEEKIVPFRFDWNHGDVGRYMGYHCTPYVTPWNSEKFTFERNIGLAWPEKQWRDSGPWYSTPHATGGYAAHWPDDQLWAYSLNYVRLERDHKYLSEITRVFAKPLDEGGRVNRFKVCTNNLWGRTDRWGNKSIGLMRPNMSPDGTKLLFNANVFCRDGVFMVVCAKPLPPTNVVAEHRGCEVGVEVRWKVPKYHREIVGYNVYRSAESGKGFRLITPTPVKGTEFLDEEGDLKVAHFYAVRSVERSGLESPLSEEAAIGPMAADWLAVFCEAETAIPSDLDAPSPDAIWMNFEGLASNLHFIWQRRKDKAGSVQAPVKVVRSGKYYVFARVKGKEGATFTIAGQSVSAQPSTAWQWVRSEGAAELSAGDQTVEIASSKYGSSLDCFYLAEDKDYKPLGRIITDKPKALTLTLKADGDHARLTWTGAKSPRWRHYNLYVSETADFTPTQATLLASPDRETYLDWQVKPGQKFSYRVTQVTKDGLESPASNPVTMP